MNVLPVYRKSFFTSRERTDGLGLVMRYERGLVYTDMNIGAAFEGYDDLVHGGILFGVLDALMWYAIFLETKKICMTRKTDMEFLRPVQCGVTYRAQGKLASIEGRDVWATAWIEDEQKKRHAQANALFRETKHLDYGRFIGNFDFTGVSPEIEKLIREPISPAGLAE